MYKYIDLDRICLDRQRDKIYIFDKEYGNSFFLKLTKGYINRKITNDSKYVRIEYFGNGKEKTKTFRFLEIFKNFLEEKLAIKIENFYGNNNINVFLQKVKNRVILEIYMKQYNKIWEKELLDLDDEFYVIPIIHIDYLVLKNNKWYLNIKLVQIIVYPLYTKIGSCILDDDNITSKTLLENKLDTNSISNIVVNNNETNNIIKAIEHPLYSKYFKMINMGVPKMAVLIKMRNELNIDGEDILSKTEFVVNKIRIDSHKTYGKYFKMLKMGIPEMAVIQKMKVDNIDINLDKPDELVLDIDIIIKNDLSSEILKKKDKLKVGKEKEILVKKSEKIVRGINLDELMKKRNLIFSKN